MLQKATASVTISNLVMKALLLLTLYHLYFSHPSRTHAERNPGEKGAERNPEPAIKAIQCCPMQSPTKKPTGSN